MKFSIIGLLSASLAWSSLSAVSAEGSEAAREVNSSTCTPTTNNPTFSQEELYEMTTNFWSNFIYPKNCAQSHAINSSLLAENVQGRIDITRTFDGVELNTEYIFGLFCNLQTAASFNVLGTPINFTYTQFLGQGNLVANTVLVYFNLSSIGLVSPITIQSYINFDSCGRISQYDAAFKWMDWQFQTVSAAGAALIGTTNTTAAQDAIASQLATNICGVAQEYCTGELQQYDTLEACQSFLTEQIPFGEAWQLGMNTLVCRDVHVNMVPYRPSVHCPHIGPSGGGYCTNDRSYATFVENSFFTDEGAMLQIPS